MTKPIIGFAGMTHLGLNSSAAAASRGFDTVCFDTDVMAIANLKAGILPVTEPGLPELLAQNRQRISYVADVEELKQCDVIYIAADVITDDQGRSDLSSIRTLIGAVMAGLRRDAILVILCQVPPGFTRRLSWPKERLYYQVETLIFGRAVERATHPERFIVGCDAPKQPLPQVFSAFLSAFGCPILRMRYESAELAKISINCCLVASVTVANTLAELSERIGGDWAEIAPALKLDKRIGQYAYLSPGLGLAGGNLERDLETVLQLAQETGSDAGLVRSFLINSRHRRDWVLRILHDEVLHVIPNPVIGVLGLAYKENTNSTKNAVSFDLIRELKPWRLQVHDPVVPASVVAHPDVKACASPLEAAQSANAVAIMTPWPVYRELRTNELAEVMAGRTIIDPHRVLDRVAVAKAGMDHFTLGVSPLRSDSFTKRLFSQ